RIFILGLVAPGDLLTQVHAIHDHLGIEGKLSALRARGTRRDDDGIRCALLEVLADQANALFAAQKWMRAAHRHLVLALCDFGELAHVHRLTDGAAATDVHAQTLIHAALPPT